MLESAKNEVGGGGAASLKYRKTPKNSFLQKPFTASRLFGPLSPGTYVQSVSILLLLLTFVKHDKKWVKSDKKLQNCG